MDGEIIANLKKSKVDGEFASEVEKLLREYILKR